MPRWPAAAVGIPPSFVILASSYPKSRGVELGFKAWVLGF